MRSCPLCEVNLKPILTKQGAQIDICPQCQGVWLDKDEIYYFTRRPRDLRTSLKEGLEHKWITGRKSPGSGEPLFEVPMFNGDVNINYCSESGGIWIDKSYLDRLPADKLKIEIDKGVFDPQAHQESIPPEETSSSSMRPVGELMLLPNLTSASFSVIFGMYAMLTLILIFVCQITGMGAAPPLLIDPSIP